MTIDPDVQDMAAHFGVDPALIQAVVQAEGNIVKAVQCTFPHITTKDAALDVTCRSAVHALSDFVKSRYSSEFIDFWQRRWAPLKAKNDPTNLNANWSKNVRAGWK